MKKITFIILIFFCFLLLSIKPSVATVYFQDDFTDGNADDWLVEFLTPPDPNHPYWQETQWNVNSDDQYGIRLPHGDMRTFSSNGSLGWTDYIFKVQMVGKEGIDKNIIFRYQNKNNWYGFHMVPDGVHLGMMINGSYLFDTRVSNVFFTNDKIYNLKIKISGGSVSLYENNNPIVENYPVWNNPLSSGKIGLYASTGANYPTSVWFDNVMVCSLDDPCEPSPTLTPTPTLVPTPTQPQPIPIVFLPGLGGSISFKAMFLGDTSSNEWQLTPGVNVYQNILKAFNYPDNPNFYVFFYDWRKPVLDNAQKLDDFIKNTVKPWNNKVDLIGHSLGGLVARACVQKTDDHCLADKLITVGSPHFGAVDAYPALEGGEIWRTGPIKLGYELLVHYFQQPGETRRETIQRIAPVLNDLLPNFDYLIKNGSNLPPSDLLFKNTLLPVLTDLTPLETLTHTLSGRGFNSVEQIILTDASWIDKLLGNWPDGKPVDKQPTLEGDTSVLVKSSSFADPLIKNFTYDLDHGGIISEQVPLTKIMEILGLELKPGTYNSLADEKNFLVFLVHSPVKIFSPDAMPGGYSTDELIIIPSPENKNYTLDVSGIGDGYYLLSVGQILGERVIWHDYFDETHGGKNQSFTFSVNPQFPSENPLLDPDGTTTVGQLKSRVNEFEKEIHELGILSKYQKMLLELLNKIQKEVMNPQSVFAHLKILRQTLAKYEKEEIINQGTAILFRKKASGIAEPLEFLASLKPKLTTESEAQDAIQSAENIRDSIKLDKLSKNGALIYVEAQEKLNKANQAFGKAEYYRAKILAFEAGSLFLESKLIK